MFLQMVEPEATIVHAIIINITRFGDLLQGQPVLTGLAGQGYSNKLICLENFGGATSLLNEVEDVRQVPGASYLATLQRHWPQAVSDFWRMAREPFDGASPDIVVNLTPSLPARLLARAVAPQAPLRGFGIDDFGFGVSGCPWAAFLEAASLCRGASPFNVVDIFRRVAGLQPAAGKFSLRQPDQAIRDSVLVRVQAATPAPAPSGLIGFQLGASEDRRQWPVEYFAHLGSLLWSENKLMPVLLGSKGEQPLAERYRSLADHPFVDMVGHTSLSELAAALTQTSLLVTNDTGTMHLAAGLGVPTVAIFLATAQPWDTGAYQRGAISLEPDMDCHPCSFGCECTKDHACRRIITPQAVKALVLARLGLGPWPGRDCLGGVRAWESDVDPWGYLGLTSINGLEDRPLTRWRKLQRVTYRRFLDGESPHDAIRGADALGAPAVDSTVAGCLADIAAPLAEADGLLTLLAGQAGALEVAPRQALKVKFLAGWQRLLSVLEQAPMLRGLAQMLAMDGQAAGEQMGEVRSALERYQRLVQELRTGLASGMNVD